MAATITPPGKGRIVLCPDCRGVPGRDCLECRGEGRYIARSQARVTRRGPGILGATITLSTSLAPAYSVEVHA
jgi:hypothetical protein